MKQKKLTKDMMCYLLEKHKPSRYSYMSLMLLTKYEIIRIYERELL